MQLRFAQPLDSLNQLHPFLLFYYSARVHWCECALFTIVCVQHLMEDTSGHLMEDTGGPEMEAVGVQETVAIAENAIMEVDGAEEPLIVDPLCPITSYEGITAGSILSNSLSICPRSCRLTSVFGITVFLWWWWWWWWWW